jgi:hypothetical protein
MKCNFLREFKNRDSDILDKDFNNNFRPKTLSKLCQNHLKTAKWNLKNRSQSIKNAV